MKKIILLTSLVSVLTYADAMSDRKFKKDEVEPVVQASMDKWKEKCGCLPRADVKWEQFKTKDDLFLVKRFFEGIKDGTDSYCSDTESKKAFCELKTFQFAKGKESLFTFKDSIGTAISDGQSYPSFDMVKNELDK